MAEQTPEVETEQEFVSFGVAEFARLALFDETPSAARTLAQLDIDLGGDPAMLLRAGMSTLAARELIANAGNDSWGPVGVAAPVAFACSNARRWVVMTLQAPGGDADAFLILVTDLLSLILVPRVLGVYKTAALDDEEGVAAAIVEMAESELQSTPGSTLMINVEDGSGSVPRTFFVTTGSDANRVLVADTHLVDGEPIEFRGELSLDDLEERLTEALDLESYEPDKASNSELLGGLTRIKLARAADAEGDAE